MKRIFVVLSSVLCFLNSSFSQSPFSLSLDGGVTTGLGQFDAGHSLSGTIFYELTQSIQISLSSGNVSWKGTNNAIFRATPILAGSRFTLGNSDFVPYGLVELGLYLIDKQYAISSVNPAFPHEPYVYKTAFVKFGYGVGLGLLYRLTDYLKIDFSGKINHIIDSGPSYYAPATGVQGYYSNLSVGFQFHF